MSFPHPFSSNNTFQIYFDLQRSLQLQKICNVTIPSKLLKNRNSQVLPESFPKLNNTYECSSHPQNNLFSNLKIPHYIS